MKKVNIVTYCVPTSYGSVLQSYALKHTLKSLGFESRIIETETFPSENYKVKLEGALTPRNLVVYILAKFLEKTSAKRLASMQSFIDEKMDIDYYRDYEKLKEEFSDEDIFLAGSDQILHPVKLLPAFFLDFAPENAKKLTYAASMGMLDIPENNKDKFGALINNFDVLSVRETEMVPVLKKYTDKPITVNIDPVFLYGRENWRKIEKPYNVKKPYILVYAIYWNSSLNSRLKKLHKDTGYDILVVSNEYRNIYCNRWVFDSSLEEFLWLIDNAEAVVSSSFHGVAMSLIFNKKLAAVINPASSSRVQGILDTVEYTNLSISQLAEEINIDFDKINANIEEEKQKSTDYLNKVLK